jgi:hypothetical protein
MPVLSAQLSHHDLLGAGVVAPLASKKRITHQPAMSQPREEL